jgi:RNA polymerase-binding transcription factor DksA
MLTTITKPGEVLRYRLDELTRRATRISEELRRPLEADPEEQALTNEDTEALEEIEHSLREAITATRQALARVESGTYGYCIRCGEAISPRRLKALPTATHCIVCAQ